MFLQQNNIANIAELADRITKINEDFKAVAEEIKKIDSRLNTLTLHFYQHENYKKHQDIYAKYKKLDAKKSEAFYDKHYEAIQKYEAARTYLNGVMGDNKTLPSGASMGEATKDAYKRKIRPLRALLRFTGRSAERGVVEEKHGKSHA